MPALETRIEQGNGNVQSSARNLALVQFFLSLREQSAVAVLERRWGKTGAVKCGIMTGLTIRRLRMVSPNFASQTLTC